MSSGLDQTASSMESYGCRSVTSPSLTEYDTLAASEAFVSVYAFT